MLQGTFEETAEKRKILEEERVAAAEYSTNLKVGKFYFTYRNRIGIPILLLAEPVEEADRLGGLCRQQWRGFKSVAALCSAPGESEIAGGGI